MVDWKMAPDSCVERRSLATFQRKCGLRVNERSTVRMGGMVSRVRPLVNGPPNAEGGGRPARLAAAGDLCGGGSHADASRPERPERHRRMADPDRHRIVPDAYPHRGGGCPGRPPPPPPGVCRG